MKQFKVPILGVLALLAFQAGSAQTIKGSKHDFSTQSWNTSVGKQICIVCHTPHNARTTVTDAPLWNHATTSATYTLYSSSTLDAVPGQPDASSKLCLSCHDGTVAVENFGTITTGTTFLTGGPLIGTDLKNDHPISITYDAALSSTDKGLKNPTTALGIGSGTISATMLFSGKLQCASCHDVHNTTGFTSGLLVKSNAASDLCLTCHIK